MPLRRNVRNVWDERERERDTIIFFVLIPRRGIVMGTVRMV